MQLEVDWSDMLLDVLGYMARNFLGDDVQQQVWWQRTCKNFYESHPGSLLPGGALLWKSITDVLCGTPFFNRKPDMDSSATVKHPWRWFVYLLLRTPRFWQPLKQHPPQRLTSPRTGYLDVNFHWYYTLDRDVDSWHNPGSFGVLRVPTTSDAMMLVGEEEPRQPQTPNDVPTETLWLLRSGNWGLRSTPGQQRKAILRRAVDVNFSIKANIGKFETTQRARVMNDYVITHMKYPAIGNGLIWSVGIHYIPEGPLWWLLESHTLEGLLQQMRGFGLGDLGQVHPSHYRLAQEVPPEVIEEVHWAPVLSIKE